MYFPAYELPSQVNGAGTALEPTGAGVPITRPNFQVEFDSYETSKAEDGYCLFSEQPSLAVTTSSATTGQELIARIPVQMVYANIKMFSLAYWYGPPAFRIPVGGYRAIPGPPRQQPNNYPSTYDDQNSNKQASCEPFYQILSDLTDEFQQSCAYESVCDSRINDMKGRTFPVKKIAPGNILQDAGNQAALKVIAWTNFLRPFGYGEAMLPVSGLTKRTSRHGFSSMFKFANSPYLGLNGLWAPDAPFITQDVSKYTSDGVIPFPFIQPELTATGGAGADVAVAWAAASYQDATNVQPVPMPGGY